MTLVHFWFVLDDFIMTTLVYFCGFYRFEVERFEIGQLLLLLFIKVH